ncbi:hypothetical protein Tco_0357250 [Tanacetum coccineum]
MVETVPDDVSSVGSRNVFVYDNPYSFIKTQNFFNLLHKTRFEDILVGDFVEGTSYGLRFFDQYQPSRFSVTHQPPQATDTEMLQARENLMEAIQAFLKEYDHIPPKEKCMALLLAEERFLKIKQAMEEEHNQPEVMQDLLLKLMNDLQILNGIQPKQEEHAAQSFLLNWNIPMADDDEYTICHTPKRGLDGIRVRGRDVIIF